MTRAAPKPLDHAPAPRGGPRPRPAMITLPRVSDGTALVPSAEIPCDFCARQCWLSVQSGPQVRGAARRRSESGEVWIICTACLTVILGER